MASTATGSTAEMSAPKVKDWIRLSPSRSLSVQPATVMVLQRISPMPTMLMTVPTTAKTKMDPMLAKKALNQEKEEEAKRIVEEISAKSGIAEFFGGIMYVAR